MKKKWLIGFLLIAGAVVYFLFNKEDIDIKPVNKNENVSVETAGILEKIYPVAEFKERITKKSFGDFISPKNSPIQPERFAGFHTGVDIEYDDVEGDVWVVAACDGEIVLRRWVSGYGGTIGLKCQINSIDYYLIYGHLSTNSINQKTKVTKGEKLAILGKGFSQGTDYERKHLHFGISQNSLDIRGYVQNENELGKWIDPLTTELVY